MKLGKISLAAVIALGSLSTASFAQPLEEAIKGVDASGYMRYRWTDTSTELNSSTSSTDSRAQEFKSGLTLKTPMADNLQGVLNVTYKDTDDNANEANQAADGTTATNATAFNVQEMYMVYAPESTKTTAILGKKTIGSVLTDDMKANGLWAINADLPNTTLVAVYLTELVTDGDLTPAASLQYDDTNLSSGQAVGANDVLALAAIVNYEPVTAQVWYHDIANSASNVFAQVDLGHTVDGIKLGLGVQYASTSVDDNVTNDGVTATGQVPVFGVDSDFWGVQGTVGYDIFSLTLGYTKAEADKGVADYLNQIGGSVTEASSGKVQDSIPVSFLALEDNGAYFGAGELAKANMAVAVLNNYGVINYGHTSYTDVFVDEVTTMYAKFDTEVPAVAGLSLGLEYTKMENDLDGNNTTNVVRNVEANEWTLRATYKHNKNWTFSSYYADCSVDVDTNANSAVGANSNLDYDVSEFRVEVKYSF